MGKDYIPASDAELLAFGNNYLAAITATPAIWGLSAGDVAGMNDVTSGFSDDLGNHITAQAQAKMKRQAKDASRRDLIALLRSQIRRVQAHPGVNDMMRAELGITIPDLVPTPIPAPTTAPILTVDFSNRGEHSVNFKDELTPNSKAKPAGVVGCAIYRKVTDVQPAGISTMEYVGTSSSSPQRLVYEESQYGSQVFYVGFWETAKGLRGPMSDFTNATISK